MYVLQDTGESEKKNTRINKSDVKRNTSQCFALICIENIDL